MRYRLLAVDPWGELVGAPMASEFFDACERIDPAVAAEHRELFLQFVAEILGDERSAEVYLLSLDGLLADDPAHELLERRMQLLAARFAPPKQEKRARK